MSSSVLLAPGECVSEAETRRQSRGFSGGPWKAERKQGWKRDLLVEGTSDSEASDVGASGVARVLGCQHRTAVTLLEAGGDMGCQWPKHSARVKLRTLCVGFDAPSTGATPRGGRGWKSLLVERRQNRDTTWGQRAVRFVGAEATRWNRTVPQAWHGTVSFGGFRTRKAKASRPRIDG